MKTATNIALLLGLLSAGCARDRALVARRELAAMVPQIVSITLYDISDTRDSLAGATSTPFPVDVFTRAAESAQHHSGITIWKGSSLAVLTLRDGAQRRARFSYYGGFFTLEGFSGRFVVPSSTGFHDTFIRLVQERNSWHTP